MGEKQFLNSLPVLRFYWRCGGGLLGSEHLFHERLAVEGSWLLDLAISYSSCL